MRITCPNCNAQYEVGDDMIPSEGRDVQCSNCGTTWFQEGRARVATAVEARAVRRPGRAEPKADEVASDLETDTLDDETPLEEVAEAAIPSRHRRPTIDDETLNVLRQERELEDRLRAENPFTETSDSEESSEADPEPNPDPREQAAAERARLATAATLARARDGAVPTMRDNDFDDEKQSEAIAEAPEEDAVSSAIAATMRDASSTEDEAAEATTFPAAQSGAVPSAAKSSRRELLPDIEEINSSLRPDERAAEAEAEANGGTETTPALVRRSSGFRIGFLVIAALIAVAAGLYVFAGPITDAVPQIGATLARYVAWVDAQRIALAAAAEALTARIAPES